MSEQHLLNSVHPFLEDAKRYEELAAKTRQHAENAARGIIKNYQRTALRSELADTYRAKLATMPDNYRVVHPWFFWDNRYTGSDYPPFDELFTAAAVVMEAGHRLTITVEVGNGNSLSIGYYVSEEYLETYGETPDPGYAALDYILRG